MNESLTPVHGPLFTPERKARPLFIPEKPSTVHPSIRTLPTHPEGVFHARSSRAVGSSSHVRVSPPREKRGNDFG